MARIAIVDDERYFADAMADVLSAEHEITGIATSGRQALDLVERTQPDVVLLDYHLRDMDGAEVTRRLREKGPDPRVFVLTGDPGVLARDECLYAGADRVLLKGGGLEPVLEALREASGAAAIRGRSSGSR